MNYDFTSVIERHGKDAIAVDMPSDGGSFAPARPQKGFSLIPMWIADMNFPTVPTAVNAMIERVNHSVFGYFRANEDYYNSIIRWHQLRNGVTDLPPEAIGYENGVQGGIVSAVDAFSCPGDKILIHSPTYIGFTKTLENKGYRLIHSDLYQDESGIWRMNYDDMNRKIREHSIHTVILCSPHNPTGRVWEDWELKQAMEIFKANDCLVISDEIWSDILLNGHKHIPTQSISDDAKNRTVAFYAPSKTFNLAGLIGSYHIIYNTYLRDRIRRQASLCHYNTQNVISMHALIGAYKPEGHEWVDQLCQVLSHNINYAYDYILHHFPGITLAKPEGTYMLYLDCEEWCLTHHQTMDELLKAGWNVGVAWQDGRPFHRTYAIRMNLALPHSQIVEAFDRLHTYVFSSSI